MHVKVLGCSGGIGGSSRTTSLLIDHDILIDAGTGVGDLSIKQLAAIDHIFVSHAHLDHITSIPFLVDTVYGVRTKHITVHATQETWQTLKDHIFNWKVWADFSVIPDENNPFLRHQEISLGKTVELAGRKITPLPANHVVPTVGFHLDSGEASMVFTSDTTTCDALWEEVNKISNLKYLIIETSFRNSELELSRISKHLCPSLLFAELAKLERKVPTYITHLKPGEGAVIMTEIGEGFEDIKPLRLLNSQAFTF
jgi:Cft2 family RNA processing exonuclease